MYVVLIMMEHVGWKRCLPISYLALILKALFF